jgi:hypothetical protein
MSQDELKAQSETINRIDESVSKLDSKFDRSFYQLKKLWPAMLIVCALLGAGATAEGIWDNQVAKKSDIEKVLAQNALLSKQLTDMTVVFTNHRISDSIEKQTIKTALTAEIMANTKAISAINKKLTRLASGTLVTGHKGKDGGVTFERY